MTPGDDLNHVRQTLDYVATLQRSHDEQIGKLVKKTDFLAERMTVLTDRTIQAMEAITRLARIADIHEDRIDVLENPPQ